MLAWLKKHHVLHSWGKWAVAEKGDIFHNPYGIPIEGVEKTRIGTYIRQERECEVCGLKQFKTIHP